MDKETLKKVCVVTAARSEYGLLRWVMEYIKSNPLLTLQIVVTGSHLSEEFGLTYKYIEYDGFTIDAKVNMDLHTEDLRTLPYSMGLCAMGMGEAFNLLKPDMVVILGDRYELLPIASTALVMNIPIAHISGGDITEGAIDNEVRNAITMMATLHFPGVKDSADNIDRMRNDSSNVYQVGEPGLDSFYKYELLTREQLSIDLGLDINMPWMLVTLHSETKAELNYNEQLAVNLYQAMEAFPSTEFIITKANADFGGVQINNYWDSIDCNHIKVFKSLGHLRYLSVMKQVVGVIGNSSSGIVEAPFLGVPVVNIGSRQKGRHICKNVICCEGDKGDIIKAMGEIPNHRIVDTYWGDGHTSEKIVNVINAFLNE